jgi:cell division septal protein FtsQ
MSSAAVRRFQQRNRNRWRRLLLPMFAIWLTGSLLITVAFVGWLSESAVSRSNLAREQTVSPRVQMRF